MVKNPDCYYATPEINKLLHEAGFRDFPAVYQKIFSWLEEHGLYVHDLWVSPIQKWTASVIDMQTGGRLWPEVYLNTNEIYYPLKKTVWDLAITAALKISILRNNMNQLAHEQSDINKEPDDIQDAWDDLERLIKYMALMLEKPFYKRNRTLKKALEAAQQQITNVYYEVGSKFNG